MDRAEFQKHSMFNNDEDDERKDRYINELGESVHNYIRTGVKNSQLDELIELEEKFHKKYEERFELEKIVKAIKEASQEKIKESNHLDGRGEQDIGQDDLIWQNGLCQNFFENIFSSVAEVLRCKWEKVLKDAAYLSHVNMLYELYEQEEKLRREEQEFEEMSAKYQKLADISKKLGEKRRMELKELERRLEISEQELGYVIHRCEGYFNVRHAKDHYIISLSTIGRRYVEYISNNEKKYDKAVWDQLVYKNCNNIIDGFKKSYNSGIKCELRLDGISSEHKRVVRHNYFEALKDILDTEDIVYDMNDINEIAKRRGDLDGKCEIRFPDEWNE